MLGSQTKENRSRPRRLRRRFRRACLQVGQGRSGSLSMGRTRGPVLAVSSLRKTRRDVKCVNLKIRGEVKAGYGNLIIIIKMVSGVYNLRRVLRPVM